MLTNLSDRLRMLSSVDMWEWPERAEEWIREGLADADPKNRELACQLAGENLTGQLADRLLQILRHDANPEIAGAAAISLGPSLERYEMEDIECFDDDEKDPLTKAKCEEMLHVLRQVYEDPDRPKLVRRRSLEAAVRGPVDWQSQAVAQRYGDDDPDWTLTAVFAMRFVPGFDEQILEALENANETVRRHALLAAGAFDLSAAGKTLMAVAADLEEPGDLRLAAIEALAHTNPPGSHSLLVELAAGDNQEIVEMAEYALEERDLLAGDPDLETDDDWP